MRLDIYRTIDDRCEIVERLDGTMLQPASRVGLSNRFVADGLVGPLPLRLMCDASNSVRLDQMWINAVLVGGFTLAGAATQQALAHWTDVRRAREARKDLRREERHDAMVQAVKAGRRVQRALSNAASGVEESDERYGLDHAVNSLAESVAALRVVVDSQAVVLAFREFEEKAKELQRLSVSEPTARRDAENTLVLSPLILAIQAYEDQS